MRYYFIPVTVAYLPIVQIITLPFLVGTTVGAAVVDSVEIDDDAIDKMTMAEVEEKPISQCTYNI